MIDDLRAGGEADRRFAVARDDVRFAVVAGHQRQYAAAVGEGLLDVELDRGGDDRDRVLRQGQRVGADDCR